MVSENAKILLRRRRTGHDPNARIKRRAGLSAGSRAVIPFRVRIHGGTDNNTFKVLLSALFYAAFDLDVQFPDFPAQSVPVYAE